MLRLDRICALALLFASATATAEPVVLKDIRLWASPDSTRIVLDLSAPASHAMFALSDPERIVVDLEQTEADLTALKMPEGTGIVSAVRLGARDGGAGGQPKLADEAGSDHRPVRAGQRHRSRSARDLRAGAATGRSDFCH